MNKLKIAMHQSINKQLKERKEGSERTTWILHDLSTEHLEAVQTFIDSFTKAGVKLLLGKVAGIPRAS